VPLNLFKSRASHKLATKSRASTELSDVGGPTTPYLSMESHDIIGTQIFPIPMFEHFVDKLKEL
jgi:hypothetical protein